MRRLKTKTASSEKEGNPVLLTNSQIHIEQQTGAVHNNKSSAVLNNKKISTVHKRSLSKNLSLQENKTNHQIIETNSRAKLILAKRAEEYEREKWRILNKKRSVCQVHGVQEVHRVQAGQGSQGVHTVQEVHGVHGLERDNSYKTIYSVSGLENRDNHQNTWDKKFVRRTKSYNPDEWTTDLPRLSIHQLKTEAGESIRNKTKPSEKENEGGIERKLSVKKSKKIETNDLKNAHVKKEIFVDDNDDDDSDNDNDGDKKGTDMKIHLKLGRSVKWTGEKRKVHFRDTSRSSSSSQDSTKENYVLQSSSSFRRSNQGLSDQSTIILSSPNQPKTRARGKSDDSMRYSYAYSDLKIPAQILLSENIYEEIRTPPLNSPGGSSSDSSTTFSGSSTETDSAKSTNTTQRNLKNAGKKLRNAPRQSRKSAGSLDSATTESVSSGSDYELTDSLSRRALFRSLSKGRRRYLETYSRTDWDWGSPTNQRSVNKNNYINSRELMKQRLNVSKSLPTLQLETEKPEEDMKSNAYPLISPSPPSLSLVTTSPPTLPTFPTEKMREGKMRETISFKSAGSNRDTRFPALLSLKKSVSSFFQPSSKLRLKL